jgi:ClpP class serine protease
VFDHVLDAVCSSPWVILPEKLELIAQALSARVYGTAPVTAAELAAYRKAFGFRAWDDDPPNDDDDDDEAKGPSVKARGPVQDVRGGVAVVPVRGTLTPRPGAFSSGGTSYRSITDRVQMAARDSAVRSIMLDVDSPGGSIHGVEEAAAAIRAAREVKPVWAAVDPIGASGAYWLASQADKLFVAPAGQVGSIGVVRVHIDRSKETATKGSRSRN